MYNQENNYIFIYILCVKYIFYTYFLLKELYLLYLLTTGILKVFELRDSNIILLYPKTELFLIYTFVWTFVWILLLSHIISIVSTTLEILYYPSFSHKRSFKIYIFVYFYFYFGGILINLLCIIICEIFFWILN